MVNSSGQAHHVGIWYMFIDNHEKHCMESKQDHSDSMDVQVRGHMVSMTSPWCSCYLFAVNDNSSKKNSIYTRAANPVGAVDL